MRKTTLAVLIMLMAALVATPCFAQEIEPEGLFSLNRTLWWLVAFGGGNLVHYGFYDGGVYIQEFGYPGINRCTLLENSSYLDLLVVSFFKVDYSESGAVYGIMSPLGVGVMFSVYNEEDVSPAVNTAMLIKISYNWSPPPEEE